MSTLVSLLDQLRQDPNYQTNEALVTEILNAINLIGSGVIAKLLEECRDKQLEERASDEKNQQVCLIPTDNVLPELMTRFFKELSGISPDMLSWLVENNIVSGFLCERSSEHFRKIRGSYVAEKIEKRLGEIVSLEGMVSLEPCQDGDRKRAVPTCGEEITLYEANAVPQWEPCECKEDDITTKDGLLFQAEQIEKYYIGQPKDKLKKRIFSEPECCEYEYEYECEENCVPDDVPEAEAGATSNLAALSQCLSELHKVHEADRLFNSLHSLTNDDHLSYADQHSPAALAKQSIISDYRKALDCPAGSPRISAVNAFYGKFHSMPPADKNALFVNRNATVMLALAATSYLVVPLLVLIGMAVKAWFFDAGRKTMISHSAVWWRRVNALGNENKELLNSSQPPVADGVARP